MDVGLAPAVSLRIALPRPGRPHATAGSGRSAATHGLLPLLRGAVVGSCANGIAMGGHIVGDGAPPSAAVLTATAVGVALLSVGMSRWRWTFPRLLALLLVAQLPLHAAFARAEPVHVHAGHTHAAMAPETAFDWPMLLGHLLAAVVTAALLQRGEAWLHAVLDTVGLRALRLIDAPHPVHAAPGHHPFSRQDQDLPCTNAATDAWLRRGPPK
ncbi:MAG: hypothetical protein ACRDO0_05600 [Nocardioidaceae bacterium]